MYSKIAAAIQTYGLTPDSITAVKEKTWYAQVFRATSEGQAYLVRLRAEWATPDEVRFAHTWGTVVSREVPVPVPLMPPTHVPRIDGRYVDISPYIAHEHANGGMVGPEAWEMIGEWVGCMHKAGMPLAGSAPRDIAYGNYPNDRVLTALFEHARSTVPHDSLTYLNRAEDVLARCDAYLRPPRATTAARRCARRYAFLECVICTRRAGCDN